MIRDSCEHICFKVFEVSNEKIKIHDKKIKSNTKKYGVASYTKMRGLWKLALLGAFVLRSVM